MRKVLFNHFFVPLFLLVLLYCFATYADEKCDKKAIICEALCKSDGDDLGIIVNNKCYCANFKDVSKVTLKVANDFRTDKKKTWSVE